MTKALHVIVWSLLAVLVGGLIHTAAAQEAEQKVKPKHAIKDVMQAVHLGPEGGKSLRDRVLSGQATAEEKQKFLDFYISLAENEPPRGKPEDWEKKTRAVILAAAKIVVGREGADKELAKATNCAACHKDHKPPQQ